MARLRVEQGFTAVQLVVGIPPEVGPENINASSCVGAAWSLNGRFNKKYLDFAQDRIKFLNSIGLMVIIYGAWGQQIKWLGIKRMKSWWNEIIKRTGNLNVIYCVTGESDLWIGEENNLLPNKSTDDFHILKIRGFLHPKVLHYAFRILKLIQRPLLSYQRQSRKHQWTQVLKFISSKTQKPIIIHTTSTNSDTVVETPSLLSAITVQTGHSENSRQMLWKTPHDVINKNPKAKYINLEPWYEGITDKFGTEDQLYAYWSSMMSGASAYCYGAHGVWNVGDGVFLAHWGKQTLDQALKLKTPKLIGQSHKIFSGYIYEKLQKTKLDEKDGKLIKITRSNNKTSFVTYYPDCSKIKSISSGKYYLPLTGKFVIKKPTKGPLVVLSI